MHNFLIWYIPLQSKDFYLIVSIIDIIMTLVFERAMTEMIYVTSNHFRRDTHRSLNLALGITALIGIIVYFTQHTCRHLVHKIYMLLRLFITVVVFIFLILLLIDIIQYSKTPLETTISIIGYACFNILNLYWSLELVKICN